MVNISRKELKTNIAYYKRVYLLAKLGGMNAEEIVERWDGELERDPADVQRDIDSLDQAVQDDQLPSEYKQDFHEIVGFHNQLRNSELDRITLTDVDAIDESLQKRVRDRVQTDLAKNAELGYPGDEITKLFDQLWHTQFLRRNDN